MRKWVAPAVGRSTTMRVYRTGSVDLLEMIYTLRIMDEGTPLGVQMTGMAIQGAKPVRPMRKTPVR